MQWFVLGFISAALLDLIRFLWRKLRPRLTYWRLERAALPDGTRVRLECGHGCGFKDHEGVWVTSWTPRRFTDARRYYEPDDYRLTRESDGETTFARQNVLVVVKDDK